jgi:hypothetical protein
MADISKSIHPLIGVFQLGNEELNKKIADHVRQEIQKELSLNEVLKHSNIGGWHSKRDLDSKLGDGSPGSNLLLLLLASFSDSIMEYIRTNPEKFNTVAKESYDWNYAGTWYNVAFGGSYNAPHVHPGAQISGAYYVRTEEPDEKHPYSGRIDLIEDNVQYPFFPHPGTLILFPSDMLHWVHPYYGSDLRICLSFNAKNII